MHTCDLEGKLTEGGVQQIGSPPSLRRSSKSKLLAISSLTVLFLIAGFLYAEPILQQHLQSKETRIIKPFVDLKSYRNIVLPNKMKVLLVHDPDTSSSAAALEVGVGSLAAPKEVLGLAHFCEHMLFMGSAKYPNINGFADMISNNNGDSNAFTSLESTNYQFRVSNQAFEKTLDIFAHFFISPTFDKAAVAKEANAVNSEFEKNFQSNEWRLYYLSQVLSDKAHPFSNFLAGNYQSLMIDPLKHNISVIDALKKFHARYYSANIMTLTVISNQPLDTLEKLVTDTFSKIPNHNAEVSNLKNLGSPLAKRKGTYALFKPVKLENTLSIISSISVSKEHKVVQPVEFIHALLKKKGKGSLFKYLADRELISEIEVATVAESSFGEIYALMFGLTEKGLNDPEHVLEAYTAYLAKIKSKSINPQQYQQYQKLSDITFNYTSSETPINEVASELASCMRKFPIEDVLKCGKRYEKFDKGVIERTLDEMKIENSMVVISSPAFESVNRSSIDTEILAADLEVEDEIFFPATHRAAPKKHHEHHHSQEHKAEIKIHQKPTKYIKYAPLDKISTLYKMEYTTRPIPIEFLQKLKNIGEEAFPEITAPKINEFVPSKLYFNHPTAKQGSDPVKEYKKDSLVRLPSQISKDPLKSSIWYQIDRSFLTPQFVAGFILKAPRIHEAAQSVVSFTLYCNAIRKMVLEKFDDAIEAGYAISIDCDVDHAVIKFQGYSDKLSQIIKSVVTKISKLDVSKEKFEMLKAETLSAIQAQVNEKLHEQAVFMMKNLLLTFSYTIEEQANALQKLTYEEWQTAVKNFDHKFNMQSVLVGDLDTANATDIAEFVQKTLNVRQIPETNLSRNSVANLRGKAYVYRVASPFKDSEDSCIFNFYQDTSPNRQSRAKAIILDGIIQNQAFSYLRTERQLGYIVQTTPAITGNALGISILVQGANKTANEMDQEIENFLRVFSSYLNKLSEKEFSELKTGIINELTQKDKSLMHKLERYLKGILDRTYRFDKNFDLSAQLKLITLGDIREYFKKLTQKNSVGKLSFQQQFTAGKKNIPIKVLSKKQTFVQKSEELIEKAAKLKKLPRLVLESEYNTKPANSKGKPQKMLKV